MIPFYVFFFEPGQQQKRNVGGTTRPAGNTNKKDGVHARGAGAAAEHASGGVHPPRFTVHATPVSNRQNATRPAGAWKGPCCALCVREEVHARRSAGTAAAAVDVSLLLHAVVLLILVEKYVPLLWSEM